MAKAALYVAMKDAGISKVQLAKRQGSMKRKCAAFSIRTTDQSCPASLRPSRR
jgi:hypothetical protein